MTAEHDIIDVEGEEIPTTAEMVHQPVGQVSIFRSSDPEQQLAEGKAYAKAVVEVVKEQNLAQSFGGNRKPHVNVEGWTFLASMFGLVPDIEWTRELANGAGWEARAQLIRLADGAVVSHAESECRRSESKGGKQRWKNANDYEIRSMAQTRATSKVCRNALSSIMVLAGFSATPAEEMDGSAVAGGGEADKPKTPDDPHCVPCLAVNGELVAVSGPHDRQPYWRCTRSASECAGAREYKGKTYSWAGFRESFSDSRDEWYEDHPEHAGPQERTVGGRLNHTGFILGELVGTLNIPRDEAKTLVKPALANIIADGKVDIDAALDAADDTGSWVEGEDLTEDQLKTVYLNLDGSEAALLVAAAVEVFEAESGTGGGKEVTAPEAPDSASDVVAELQGHVSTGAVKPAQVVAIARRIAKEKRQKQPEDIPGVAELRPSTQQAIAEAVAAKIAEGD